MDLTLKVWRQKNAKAKGHFETYKVKNISSDSYRICTLSDKLLIEDIEHLEE